MTNACSNAKRNISCPKIIQTYIPHGIVSYLKSMPQSSLETIQHIQRVNQSNVSPIRLALMIPSNLFSFFSVTASPKMFDADVLKAQLEPTWFCGCKIPGRFTWIMAPKSSEKLWVHPLVCVWCFLAPFKSLRWGPISSPLPPPISSAYTKKLIFQTSSNSKIKLNYKYANIFKPVVVLFFFQIFLFNHLQITAIFNFQTGRVAISM